jgi:peptidoglycan hydrolase CwlO-like protein
MEKSEIQTEIHSLISELLYINKKLESKEEDKFNEIRADINHVKEELSTLYDMISDLEDSEEESDEESEAESKEENPSEIEEESEEVEFEELF